jgi:hypothetical protein
MDRFVSALIWTMTALVVILGLFYVSAVWLFTAPFDKGRYRAGRAFRHLAVTQVKLNPLAFRDRRHAARESAQSLRRRFQSRIIRGHLSHKPLPVGDEMALQV